MASKRPAESVDEEMKTRKEVKDEDEAQALLSGDNATGCGSDMQPLNISAEGGHCVNAPLLSQNNVQRDINININTTINNNGAGTSTPANPAQEHGITSSIERYKKSVKSSYEMVMEYTSRLGESVFLSDRYTELLMVKCHKERQQRENEMRARGEQHQEVLKSAENKITIEQFFRPEKEQGNVPKAVILQGNSGYGKSFTAQKIVLDWASGDLFKDSFDLVLHLKCKEINEISEECSLVDLLNYSPDFTNDTAEVLRDPNVKVLVLVDGFDELKFSLEDDKNPPPKDPFKKAPVQATLKALLKGHILPEYRLLLTTRSTATDKLSRLVSASHRFVDILGFNEEAVKEFFHRFFHGEQDDVFQDVKNNETLYTACFIPVICWVICSVFRDSVAEDAPIPMELETTTSIFAHFLSTLLEYHSRDSSLSVPALLSSLGQLAEKGMQEQRVLFSKDEVVNMVSDPERGPFLCKFLLKKKVKQEEMFSFMHLSFQEFFTALHYTLDKNREKLKELLDSYTREDWQSHRQPVIQFLFGLANTELIENLDGLQLTPYTSSIKSHLEEWYMKEIKQHFVPTSRLLFILHCLYELHEEDFVRKAMDAWGPLSFGGTSLTRMDCWVLRYCLLCCPTIKGLKFEECRLTDEMLKILQPALSRCEELRLPECNLTGSSCSSLAAALTSNSSSLRLLDLWGNTLLGDSGVEQLSTALKDSNCRLETLRLPECNLTDSSCSFLAAALTSNSSSLRHLGLNGNKLGDSGVEPLSTALEDSNCRLETLELQDCNLTESSCSSLAPALKSNSSSLRHLDLSYNYKLGESGVELLSTGLEHRNCRLETLELEQCDLTGNSCSFLAAALRSNSSSLKHLDVSGNDQLGDSGVRLLSTALEDSNCRLQTLELVYCGITAVGCAALASALKSNPSSHLTHLDLKCNKLGASVVKQLSALLKDPDYKLQEVKLQQCALTESSCLSLAAAFISNSSRLRHLYLSGNTLLGDLKTLELQGCDLTESSCSSLAAALKSNSSSVRHLDLSENTQLGDSGVRLLSTGLAHANCRLETLKLQYCDLTESSCSSLAAALRSDSSSLRHLDLSWNKLLGDSGVKLPKRLWLPQWDLRLGEFGAAADELLLFLRHLDLSENDDLGHSGVKLLSTGLEHPNCRLETLGLRRCGLTMISCSSLAAALRSNSSSLRLLDLSENRQLGDSGVTVLSTGLDYPNCRLETLKLADCSITAKGCAALASALTSNPSSHLTDLNLRCNTLGASLELAALVDDPNYKLQKVEYDE